MVDIILHLVTLMISSLILKETLDKIEHMSFRYGIKSEASGLDKRYMNFIIIMFSLMYTQVHTLLNSSSPYKVTASFCVEEIVPPTITLRERLYRGGLPSDSLHRVCCCI